MEYTKIPKEVIDERDEICTPLTVGETVSMRKAKDSITYFCYHQLGITPYAWQHMLFNKVIKDDQDILACTPRQVGKSFAVAVTALHHVTYNTLPIASKGKRTIMGIASKSEGQSKKIIKDIRALMDIGDDHIHRKYGVKDFFKSRLSVKQSDTNSKTQLTFREPVSKWDGKKKIKVPEGKIVGEIIAVPATESARGNTFSKLFMDEAAFFEMDDFYSTVAEPTLRSTNGHSIVTTTPHGQRGWFFKVFDPFDDTYVENPYYRLWLHWEHIENEQEKEAVLTKQKNMEQSGEIRQFEQEYEARFTSDASSFFDAERVDEMFDKTMTPWDRYDKPTELGIDVGFETSRSVVTISRLGSDGIIRRVWHNVYPQGNDMSLVEDVIKLIPLYNVQRVIIDHCPAASGMIQDFRKRGVNIKLMSFKKDKSAKYFQFRSKMYKGLIKSYPDRKLSAEMKALEEIEGIRSTRIEKPKSGSDDSIDSFVISTYFYIEDSKGLRTYDLDEVD